MGKYQNRTFDTSLKPMNDAQRHLMTAIASSEVVIVTGPAGTGKTYVTASMAAQMKQSKDIQKIVITRPHVPVGQDIGFLPGDLAEKTHPWALPVLSVLQERLGKSHVESLVKETDSRPPNIEVVPLAMIRGRSFDNTFMIVDEAQNLTLHELKALVTRQGKYSKLVLNGDITQRDDTAFDGLPRLIDMVYRYHLPVPVIEFGIKDVVRSGITKMWLETFYEEGV